MLKRQEGYKSHEGLLSATLPHKISILESVNISALKCLENLHLKT